MAGKGLVGLDWSAGYKEISKAVLDTAVEVLIDS